jgi:hypothetical protein
MQATGPQSGQRMLHSDRIQNNSEEHGAEAILFLKDWPGTR